MDHILEINNLSKTYHNKLILDKVSFKLPKGCIMGLIGENGTGKTTIINSILDTINIDSGTIKLFNQDYHTLNKLSKNKIGIVYDGSNFPDYLNAIKLSKIMNDIYDKWDQSLFNQLLNEFRLDRKQVFKSYSKGMLIKLAIASALAHHPQLLILDEPTSGLDPITRNEILDIFLDFVAEEENSILFSSHITSDLSKIADYITFIHQGKTVFSNNKDELIYNYGIIRCNIEQFTNLDLTYVKAYHKKKHQIDVLVTNKDYYDNVLIIDLPTIDEIMYIMIKGVIL